MSSTGRKNRSVASEIISGLSEFRDALREGKPIQEAFTVRTVELDLRPGDYGPEEIRKTRMLLSMSQAVFAQFLGVSTDTVQGWEQGRREPQTIARRFMDEIRHDPDHWLGRVREVVKEKPNGARA